MHTTTAPHGSARRFREGCRSRSACPHSGSERYLTCAEAYTAAAGRADLAALPDTTRLPRGDAPAETVRSEAALVHGTPFGFRRGCAHPLDCPHFDTALPTCLEAQRAYRSGYRRRRADGRIEHGSWRGYVAGCRDEQRCVEIQGGGLSCAEHRRRRRRRLARERGVVERAQLLDAGDCVRAIGRLVREGHSLRALAPRLGVGSSTLSRLLVAADRGDAARATAPTLTRMRAALADLTVEATADSAPAESAPARRGAGAAVLADGRLAG
ncbi:hypothetical protein FJ656_10675 [Schumannella luteola]|nr:hypothetical protein FJ656_10675 [Schumannella luteola]